MKEGNFWFNGWASVGHIVIYAVVAYVLLIALVRTLGQRTISKMNPSDFVVTIAIGSIVANFVQQAPVSLVDGVVGITTLLLLQWVTEFLTTRSKVLRTLTEGHPVLLAFHGELIRDNMKKQNVNEHEMMAALRQEGFTRLEDVEGVVLEIDGKFSVLPQGGHPTNAMADVQVRP